MAEIHGRDMKLYNVFNHHSPYPLHIARLLTRHHHSHCHVLPSRGQHADVQLNAFLGTLRHGNQIGYGYHVYMINLLVYSALNHRSL